MKKAIVIGEKSRKIKAFESADTYSAKVLMSWLGITHEKFLELFDTANMIDPDGNEMSWEEIEFIKKNYGVIILLGRVAEIKFMGYKDKVPKSGFSLEGGFIYVLPHPSGKNRQLNDKSLREKTEKMGREAAILAMS